MKLTELKPNPNNINEGFADTVGPGGAMIGALARTLNPFSRSGGMTAQQRAALTNFLSSFVGQAQQAVKSGLSAGLINPDKQGKGASAGEPGADDKSKTDIGGAGGGAGASGAGAAPSQAKAKAKSKTGKTSKDTTQSLAKPFGQEKWGANAPLDATYQGQKIPQNMMNTPKGAMTTGDTATRDILNKPKAEPMKAQSSSANAPIKFGGELYYNKNGQWVNNKGKRADANTALVLDKARQAAQPKTAPAAQTPSAGIAPAGKTEPTMAAPKPVAQPNVNIKYQGQPVSQAGVNLAKAATQTGFPSQQNVKGKSPEGIKTNIVPIDKNKPQKESIQYDKLSYILESIIEAGEQAAQQNPNNKKQEWGMSYAEYLTDWFQRFMREEGINDYSKYASQVASALDFVESRKADNSSLKKLGELAFSILTAVGTQGKGTIQPTKVTAAGGSGGGGGGAGPGTSGPGSGSGASGTGGTSWGGILMHPKEIMAALAKMDKKDQKQVQAYLNKLLVQPEKKQKAAQGVATAVAPEVTQAPASTAAPETPPEQKTLNFPSPKAA